MANGLNAAEDMDMAEYDGEKVVTMVDVLQEQEEFEQDANAVLGASDDKNCTYNKGYVKRQALYACMTCCPEAKDDPSKRAGVCLACSLSCHENHDCIELYTKRNFRCDCGNPKFSHPCNLTQAKADINESNSYNQNFSGLYCTCNRPYPDPENEVQDDMIQCIICEDWLHASHLEATVPGSDQYSEMICKGCMEKNPFLHDYNDLAVNVDTEIDILNVTSEHCDTKVNNIEMAEPANETNTDKSFLTSYSNDNKLPTVLGNKVDENKASEPDTTEETSAEDNIEKPNTEVNESNLTIKEKTDTNESEIKSSENNIESKDSDTDTKKINKVDTEHIKEDPSLIDPSLEDNIRDLTNLINEINDHPEVSEKQLNTEERVACNESKNQPPESYDTDENKDLKDGPYNEVESKEKIEDSENKPKVEVSVTMDKNIDENSKKTNNFNCSANLNSEISNETSDNITASETPLSDINVNETDDKEKAGLKKNEESDNKMEIQNLETSPTNSIHNNEVEVVKVSTEQDIVVEKIESKADQSVEENIAKELDTENKMTSNESENKNQENYETNHQIESQDIERSNCIDGYSKYESKEETNMEMSNHTDEGIKNEPTVEVDAFPNNEVPEDIVQKSPENKRKISFHTEDEVCIKKARLDVENSCVRPKGTKRIHKGATFWPSNFRQKLCTCSECLSMYKDLSVLFLIDFEDTVSFYENLGKEKIRIEGLPQSQYEKGLEALSSLGRVQQINALTEYNKLKDELLGFLKSFKERKEIVKEEDIKAFFAGMKPKREPDGVYFCR